ncbi:MAG: FecR domain-containing protein [Pseudomonadota bacterium]
MQIWTRASAVAVSIVGLLAVHPCTAFAQLIENREIDPQGEIISAKGDEELLPVGDPDWRKAILAQILGNGDELRTGPFGGLGLAFNDRTQMRIHANTRIRIDAPLSNASEPRRFDLRFGKIWSRASSPDKELLIRTPSANAAIRGTDWYLETFESGGTRLVVFDGSVEFFNDSGRVVVPPGRSAFADVGTAPVLEAIVEQKDKPRWVIQPTIDIDALLEEKLPDDRKGALRSIVTSLSTNDLVTARDALATYQEEYSVDKYSQTLLAFTDLYSGRLEDAESSISLAERLAPGWIVPVLLRAQYALLADDDALFDKATAAAIQLDPQSSAAWLWRATYLALSGYASPAEISLALDKAVSASAKSPYPLVARGDFRLAEGKPNAALVDYDTALEIDPANVAALTGRSYALIISERLNQAGETIGRIGDDAQRRADVLSMKTVAALIRGDSDTAETLSGQVIAANPGRPGATILNGIATWQAGERTAAQKIVDNAIRLDPNEPFIPLVGSIMAQDTFQASRAIELARQANAASRRSREAGRIALPASQEGRLDIGSAYRNLNLSEQGEYYSSLSRSSFNPNSAFAYGLIYPDEAARASSVLTGLLLDPLSVSFPPRFSQFYRSARSDWVADLDFTATTNGAVEARSRFNAQGLTRRFGAPLSYSGTVSVETADQEEMNDDARSVSGSFSLGTRINGSHALLGRVSVDYSDNELPGSFSEIEFDDKESNLSIVGDVGYTYSSGYDAVWFARLFGGHIDVDFENPSAFGTTLDPLSFSLATSLGLRTATELAADGIFDTALSLPNAPILAVAPPMAFPATNQVAGGLLALTDDLDPVFDISTEIDVFSFQTRHARAFANIETSIGLEYGRISSEQSSTEIANAIIGAGALIDFRGDEPVVSTFDLGEATPLLLRTRSRIEALSGHVQGRWQVNDSFEIDAGVFPVVTWRTADAANGESSTDETFSLDPRLGVAWRSGRTQARLGAQRSRPSVTGDTIAPLGVVGLLPARDPLITISQSDSLLFRVEHEATDSVFLSLLVSAEDLENISAGLSGQRTGVSAFFIEEGRKIETRAGLDINLPTGIGAGLSYSYTESSIRDGSENDGAVLPLIPHHQGSVTITYVGPSFYRVEATAQYTGRRFLDAANSIELDEAVVLSASIAKETLDRRWQGRANVQAVLSDDNPLAPGLSGGGVAFSLGVTHRW